MSDNCNPAREEIRLQALYDLDLLETEESESFDRITRMASRLFDSPISAVSLTDRNRQWFKSHLGTQGREIPREGAPCAAVTESGTMLVIPDMLADSEFADCLLARSGIRFYAGAPLTTREGHVLGAMCVLDRKPRTFSPEILQSLHDFAGMVMAQIELQRDMGRIDPISGLPNRNQLIDDLDDLERRSPGDEHVLVLIDTADARDFNRMVSILGTGYIDDLVKSSSRAIKEIAGGKAGLYHVGAASFVYLSSVDRTQSCQSLVHRILVRFEQPLVCNGVPVTINAVIGISPVRLSECSAREALRTALSAAFDAREADIGYATYSPESDGANRRRLTLLTDMREAVVKPDQLSLVYQPRLDLRTQVCVSAEALLRWKHPRLGNVSPGEFFPLVEQTALANPVTAWVVAAALDQIVEWRMSGSRLQISINVSASNLEQPDFSGKLANALERRGLPSSAIELEFTESALIRNRSRVLGQLQDLRGMGICLAIDDFGTGYSAFSYLQDLPATTVKIDQAFIRDLHTSQRDQVLVRSMIGMAHDLGYSVVAEGVQTAEAYDLLREYGCDEVQGYLVSRPLPAAEFDRWRQQGRDAQLGSMLRVLSQKTA